ncbi:MAG: hypothetical protein ACJAU6_000575 [Alphaproteobacteria bacterium]
MVVLNMLDNKPERSSPHCRPVATRLNPPQAIRYPTAKTPVGATGVFAAAPFALFLELIRANNNNIGAALGSIIAIIITHHMENISAA